MKRLIAAVAIFMICSRTLPAGELRTERGVRQFQVSESEWTAHQQFLAETNAVGQLESQTGDREQTDAPESPFRTASHALHTGGDDHSVTGAMSVHPQVSRLSTGGLALGGKTSLGDSCSLTGECGGHCSACGSYWFESEFLLWWRRGRSVPPLASTDVIGVGSVLFGGEAIGDNSQPGARFELGGYLDYAHCDSIAARFWALGDSKEQFDSRDLPAGTTVVRPFLDYDPSSPSFRGQNALPISNIGGSTGFMTVTSESNVWGGDVLWRHAYCRTPSMRSDLILGYQAARLDEDLAITHSFTNAGTDVLGREVFDVKNEFHGVVLGFQVVTQRGCWTVDVLAKVALGDMHQRVTIDGLETLTAGASQTFEGSLLALPTNIGFRERNKFAAVPELNIKTRCQLQPNLDLSIGYSFLFLSDVMQAGSLVDPVVNGSQTTGGMLNGEARPGFEFQDGTYWVHGLNVGLTWTY